MCLHADDIERAKHIPDPAFLVERGLTPEAAQLFVTIWQHTAHSAARKVIQTVVAEPVLVGTNRVAFWVVPLDDQTLV